MSRTRARRSKPLRKPLRPSLRTAGGKNQDFLFWGQGLWGKEPGISRAAGSHPRAWRLCLALPEKPAGPVGCAPLPAGSGTQGILWNHGTVPLRPSQQQGGTAPAVPPRRGWSSCLAQVRARREAAMCGAAAAPSWHLGMQPRRDWGCLSPAQHRPSLPTRQEPCIPINLPLRLLFAF